MFGPTRGFSGMANSMEPCKMLWADADPCYHGNEIWARRGDPVAYRLVFFSSFYCKWKIFSRPTVVLTLNFDLDLSKVSSNIWRRC